MAKDVNAYQRDYMARRRASARDIKEIPRVASPKRRDQASKSLPYFCKTYFADQFTLPWSPYHFRAAEKIEQAIRNGGFFAFAMPRGSGKTTICRWGVLWAVLNGHCDYVVLVGASERAAEKQLRSIRTMLCRNDLLYKDYPEATVPIRQIMHDAVLPGKQTYQGNPTCVDWQVNRLVMPWIPLKRKHGTASRGAVIEVMGITSEIRGLNHVRPDNVAIRPKLALCDDPQTRESAKSMTQSQTRLETLVGDVAYLAGPGSPIAVVCPGTVMYEGDLIDQLLDRIKHPEWRGERTKMVESFPVNMELWDRYADILKQSLREDETPRAAKKFYEDNRAPMDLGAKVSWPERFRSDELSAIQHAMNLRIRDEAAFFAECQNEPVLPQDEMELLSIDDICKKTTECGRGVVPVDATTITAFTDVQQDHLFWMLCAWTANFTGYVIDYGGWPDQSRNYFGRNDIRRKLSNVYQGDESGVMYAALTELGDKLCGAKYFTIDGRELSMGRWCIDGGFPQRRPATEFYVSQSPYKSLIAITKGFAVKAGERPLSESPRAIEQRIGPFEWYWRDGKKNGGWVTFNTNFWKTRVHSGLLRSTGSRGSISLFSAPYQVHRMLAEHLRAEKPVKVQAKGQVVHEWKDIPSRDNEGLDCLVGCAVGASICGITPDSERVQKKRTVIKTPAEWIAASKGAK